MWNAEQPNYWKVGEGGGVRQVSIEGPNENDDEEDDPLIPAIVAHLAHELGIMVPVLHLNCL